MKIRMYAKKLLFLLIAFMTIVNLSACQSDDKQDLNEKDNGQNEQVYNDPTTSDTIKILSVGNSFSDDATMYLFPMLQELGYKNIVISVLYIGSCDLETHYNNAIYNAANYEHRKNTTGSFQNLSRISIKSALFSENWDYITLQQASAVSGKPGSYDKLPQLVKYIRKYKNPGAKLMWHLTWSYQSDSNHPAFADYDFDQKKMFGDIVETYKNSVAVTDGIDGLIPAGTAIQNVRTSFIGDTVTRDGFHLNDKGKLTAALSWAKALTARSIDEISYLPPDTGIDSDMLAAIKEAANNAQKAYDEIT